MKTVPRTVVIVACRDPNDQWRYTVRYGIRSRTFRVLEHANNFAAQLIARGHNA